MTTVGRLSLALPLTLTLALAGCKEQAAKQGTNQSAARQPAAGEAPGKPADGGPSKEDIRRGIGKQLPLVQRGFAQLDLQNIAKLYAADALTGTPPKKAEDLAGLEPRVVQAIKGGQYVVLWNASPNAPGNAVVAYEKEVPAAGGMVATLNGVVTRMTPQEFQAAPKAGGR